jgi:hypothetical protein
MQKKGIVMQIADGQAIVMMKECEFRKIPLLDGMAVGQEIEVPNQTTQTVRKKPLAWFGTPLRKTGVLAASLLLAVGVWGSQSLFAPQSAYAYVTVDINPSVEFSIDQKQHVVDVKGLNDDGQQVLSNLNVKGFPLIKAVESLTAAAKTKGYFNSNTEVIITASPAVSDDKLASDHMDLDKIENDLVAQVKTAATTPGSNVDVEGIRVSEQVRTAAQKAGVSPGKYAVYLNAQSNGIDVSLDELKGQSITKVVQAHGNTMSHVVQSLEGGAKLDQLLEALRKESNKVTPQTTHPAIVEPSKQDQQQPKSTPQPPGQQKKTDDSNKKNSLDSKNPTDSKKSSDRTSDRQNGNSGNSPGNSGSHKSDDAGDHSSSKHQDGHEQKGTNEQDRSHDDRGNQDQHDNHGHSGHD